MAARRAAAPVFSHRNVAALAPVMTAAADRACARIGAGLGRSGRWCAAPWMRRCTAIMRCGPGRAALTRRNARPVMILPLGPEGGIWPKVTPA